MGEAVEGNVDTLLGVNELEWMEVSWDAAVHLIFSDTGDKCECLFGGLDMIEDTTMVLWIFEYAKI